MTSNKWAGSTRRDGLPSWWPRRRLEILKRDGGRCTQILPDGSRCVAPATEVDHITPSGSHAHVNLRSMCRPHHASKSSAEGNAAKAAKRSQREAASTRRHPGLKPLALLEVDRV